MGLALPAWCEVKPQFTNRASIEWRGFFYPMEAENDSGSWVGDVRLRLDGGARLDDHWTVNYAFDAGLDTHRQYRRDAGVFWFDRTNRRPALAVRQFSVRYAAGDWTVEAGKQVIRWGQTDLWSPTDRFAPRDVMSPFKPEYLGVTALRGAWRRGNRRIEAVYTPRFTPGRLPLPLQRWLQPPQDEMRGLAFRDIGNSYPGAGQAGVRYQQTAGRTDFSASYFEGFNHTPSVTLFYNPYTETMKLLRTYPRTRMLGGDVSRVLPWFTVRGETGWFRSDTSRTDDYVQYVVEAERVQGKAIVIAGYVGEVITESRAKNRVALDRSLTDLFLGRVQYAFNDRHDIKFEFLARRARDIHGGTAAYTRRFGQRWSWTAGAAWLDGDPATTIGQYRFNSHAWTALLCSF